MATANYKGLVSIEVIRLTAGHITVSKFMLDQARLTLCYNTVITALYITVVAKRIMTSLSIKSTKNMTCRHCKCLVTTPTDVVLYEIAIRILYIRCCLLNYIHF